MAVKYKLDCIQMAPLGGFGVPPTPPAAPPGLTPVPEGLLPLSTPVMLPETSPAAPALVGSPASPPPVLPVPSLSPSGPPSPSPGVSPLGTPADRAQTADFFQY